MNGWSDDGKCRCAWLGQWAGAQDPLYRDYHDNEWGVPEHDPVRLFELLTLEGAQAGLAWITVLRKRQTYREAFDGFDIARVAHYDETDTARLLTNSGIVRNRLKIASTIDNARAWLALEDKVGDVSAWLWSFVDGIPQQHNWQSVADIPTTSRESDTLSRALKKAGFRFVGSTICQSFLQAAGMFNDHTTECFRHREITSATQGTKGVLF